MKKTLFTIFFAAITFTAFAQYNQDNSPVTFGVKGGVNLSSLSQTISGSSNSLSSGSLTSFHAGIFADFKFGDSFSVQPSLLYTGKGGSNKESVSEAGINFSSNSKLTLNYIQLPVYALYHAQVGDNEFFIGAGPFLGYGINGTSKGSASFTADGQMQTENVNDKVHFGGSDSTGVKRMDYGISGMAGFKFSNGFLISVFYDLGLANIAPPTSNSDQTISDPSTDLSVGESNVKTHVFGISVGYSF